MRTETRARGWMPPLLFLLAALVVRAPALPFATLDPDEGLYLTQAVAWLRGGWPYVAVWDMHPPGAPALLVPVVALLPDPAVALRLAGVLAVTTTATLLHALARRLGAAPPSALAAGFLYVAHTTIRGGMATNTELLFTPFVALVALLLIGETLREAAPRPRVVLAAGLAAGVALWIKQVTALETSAVWLATMAIAWRAGRVGPRQVAWLAALFALGAGAPTLLVAAGYAAAGQFGPWLHGNLLAPLAYAEHDQVAPGWRVGLVKGLPRLAVLVLACTGLFCRDATARRAAWLVAPWLAGAALAVAAPGKFYDHYFLVMLPPLCLLAAFGLAALVRFVVRAPLRGRAFAIAVLLLSAAPVGVMLQARLAHGLGLRAPDPVRLVGRAAAAALPPGGTLFVANYHATVYALVGAMPPTPYAFPAHLSSVLADLTGTDSQAELERVLALPPDVVVVQRDRWRNLRPEARAAIEAVLPAYALVASVPDGGSPVEVWRRR
jgi:hypothetical protein